MARARRKRVIPDEEILDVFIHTYFDLGLLTYNLTREILAGKGVPPKGMVDLLGITSSEVRQNIKQKYELLNMKKDSDSKELQELIKVLKSSMEDED